MGMRTIIKTALKLSSKKAMTQNYVSPLFLVAILQSTIDHSTTPPPCLNLRVENEADLS